MKKIQSNGLKKRILEKSGAQRRAHASEARLEAVALAHGRNDLTPKLEVIYLDIDKLKPALRGVRKTSPEQMERLGASVSRFGFVMPVLVDMQHRIIAGHGLVEVAAKLHIGAVPCAILDHLSETEARALRLALNRLGETGEWDIDELRFEMEELKLDGFDLSITGFDDFELDSILSPPPEAVHRKEKKAFIPTDNAISVEGDLWQLGKHRLLCGDSTEAACYDQLLERLQVGCVFTDPPYNVPIDGHVSGLGQHRHQDFAMASGEMTPEQFQDFLHRVLGHCQARSTPGSVIFACMNWANIARIINAGEEAGLRLANLVVWNKSTGGMGSFYRSQHELIPVFCNGDKLRTNNIQLGKLGRDRTNVWTYAGANRKGSSAAKAFDKHPTPKPIELVEDALRDVTEIGELVLDPFMGSGTTIIAAENIDRVAYGIEFLPHYVDVAIRRWQEWTGKEAVHAETGQTFAEVEAIRTADAEVLAETINA